MAELQDCQLLPHQLRPHSWLGARAGMLAYASGPAVGLAQAEVEWTGRLSFLVFLFSWFSLSLAPFFPVSMGSDSKGLYLLQKKRKHVCKSEISLVFYMCSLY